MYIGEINTHKIMSSRRMGAYVYTSELYRFVDNLLTADCSPHALACLFTSRLICVLNGSTIVNLLAKVALPALRFLS